MSSNLYLRKVPLIRILIPFIIGIIGSYYLIPVNMEQTKLWFCLLLTAGIFNFLIFFIKALGKIQDFFLILFIAILGVYLVVSSSFTDDKENVGDEFCGIIYDNLELKQNSMLIPVTLIDRNQRHSFLRPEVKVNLYTSKDTSRIKGFNVGDMIAFRADLSAIKNNGNPYEFDYKRYLKNKGITLQGYACDSNILSLGYHGNLPLKRLATKIQVQIIEKFNDSGFSKDTRALLIALTVGDKSFISKEMESIFANSGAVHVLAVSGLHVGIIYLILSYLLGFMGKNRNTVILKTVIVVLFIWFYAFITGLSPSVTRAALMFTMINIGTAINRDISFFNILAGAAFVMLLVNPLNLFEVGFQLSFLAVGGIVFFQPKFYSWFSFNNPILDNLYKLITVSVAAQLTTTPLTIYYFNQFPVYFWLTNILIIPLVFCLVFLSVLYLSISWMPIIAAKVTWVLNKIAVVTNWWVELVDSLPGSVINNISVSTLSLVVLYILLSIITIWLLKRGVNYLKVALLLLILLVSGSVYSFSRRAVNEQLVVYNVSGQSAIGLYNNAGNYLLVKQQGELKDKIYYAAKNHWQNEGLAKLVEIKHIDDILGTCSKEGGVICIPTISFGEVNVAIISDVHIEQFPTVNIKADVLVIAGNIMPPKEKLEVKTVVTDGSMSTYYTGRWRNYAEKNVVEFFDTKQQGAYLQSIKTVQRNL